MRKLFIVINFLAFPFCLFSQTAAINWLKCFGGTDNDYGWAIEQTSDGGFIMVGRTSSTDGDVTGGVHGAWDFWVIKLDSNRVIQWEKSLGGSWGDWAFSVHQTSDGGYIVGGLTESNNFDVSGNHGDTDYWVVKLNSSGTIQWQKCLGGSLYEGWPFAITNLQTTTDGGYIIVGTASSTDGNVTGNHGNDDYWVVKLDSSGNIQWQKCLGGTDKDQARSVCQTSDGGYIVAGSSASIDGDVTDHHGAQGWEDYWVVKLNSSGNIQWKKSYGGTYYDNAYAIRQTADGGYVVAGSSGSINGDVTGWHGGFSDYWLVKINSSGNILWQKCYGGTGSDQLYSLATAADGGFIMSGYTSTNDGDVTGYHGGLMDAWIVKTDSLGNLKWQNCIGGTADDNLTYAIETTDGSVMAVGYENSTDGDFTGITTHGLRDFWAVKLTTDYSTISGALFIDANGNGTFDMGEYPLSNRMVIEATSGRQAFTDLNGNYNLHVFSSDTFSVSPAPLNNCSINPTSHSAVFTGFYQVDSLNHFAFVPVPGNNDLTVSITPVTAFRVGQPATYVLTYRNNGTTPLSASVFFHPDAHVTFQSASIPPTSSSNDSVAWNNIFLAPFQQGSITINVTVNSGTPVGTTLGAIANIFPVAGDIYPSDNVDGFETQVVASLDPNDKIVSHRRITPSQVSLGTPLDYVIRFQNTGNDTAFTVKVQDNISTKLNMNSFELINASHPVELQYEPATHVMVFVFNNILLPDSNVNEQASHGFIRYRITPLTSLLLGDSIKNIAAILFDYNAPVITDAAITRILNPLLTPVSATNITCFGNDDGTAAVNPSGGLAPYTYQWSPIATATQTVSGLAPGTYTVTVFDADGFESTDSVIVTEPDEIILSASQDSVMCNGDSTGSVNVSTLEGGIPPLSYIWSTGDTSTAVSGLPAGVYTVTVTDHNSCAVTTTATITQPAQLTNIMGSVPTDASCIGSASVNVNGGTPPYNYLWSNSGATSVINNLCLGWYYVTVTDVNNCQLMDSVYVNLISSVLQASVTQEFLVLPNPSTNEIKIKAVNHKIKKVEIYCTLGEKVFQSDFSNLTSQISLDISHLPAGIYFVAVRDEKNNLVTRKIVKM